jgi:transposase-like protein
VTDPLPPSRPPDGYRFPHAVIAMAVRWYVRYGLSYRDVEQLLAERGITVDDGLATEHDTRDRLAAAFIELAQRL